ncbi:TolC family protein [Stieleria marina]|uniref:Outer membrane efflux protein n=1 Tax=Stieleria marina TaxID=1930275 RepID=A0A517NZI7_9BACT|nr:Outer membrane efflux protein [Planctomycetes bacterium K23_9]
MLRLTFALSFICLTMNADFPIASAQFDMELPADEEGAQHLTVFDSQADSMVRDAIDADQSSLPATLSGNSMPLNLPTALSMVGGQHPAVGVARWRTQQAYAELEQAKVLWLPSIQIGFSFHHHDGNYQASDGQIVDVNRNSFQYGLGAGATGAGTTTQPGLVARFHLADAIFQPKIACAIAGARQHSANAVVNRQLLEVALSYLDLLDAHQEARIIGESQLRTDNLAKVTADFAEAGEGLQSDADRMQTEAMLTKNRAMEIQAAISLASARLAQAISLNSHADIVPMDVTVLPLELTAVSADKSSLISTGLSTRPELRESKALVAAACEAHRRERYAPFVPSVLLGYSGGGFGGGLGNRTNDVDGRYDFDAVVTWEIRNLGLGERAARRRTTARLQQARFETLNVMDQIAREISESSSQIPFRRQQMQITQQAITLAQASYERNLERINDGEGLPLEVLQSATALEQAQRAYLDAIMSYNQAQFRLQWALGWPITAPPLS